MCVANCEAYCTAISAFRRCHAGRGMRASSRRTAMGQLPFVWQEAHPLYRFVLCSNFSQKTPTANVKVLPLLT